MPVFQLSHDIWFPSVNNAEPNGLLAYGGDLSVERLLLAYGSGIFPWFSAKEPLLWWSPDPRFVLYPDKLKVSKSMRQLFNRGGFEITFDRSFKEVIIACSEIKRKGQEGTWITDEMVDAYEALHRAGYARSVEVWVNSKLVGGLYGIQLGQCFFGESMFSKVNNASKAGFISFVNYLKNNDFKLIDCQVYTPHLESLGAEMISRKLFLDELKKHL